MQWLEITVDTAPENIADTAAALTAAGFSDLVIEDQTELETFLAQTRDYWDYIDGALQKQLQGLSRIRLYLDASDEAGLASLKALTGKLGLAMRAKPLADENWEESWKQNFPPLEVGETLAVLPFWLADTTPLHGRTPVILDPGLTFGSGYHPSTRMVMAQMEKRLKPGASCLDLGSGNGILSITALRLGAARAIGVDLDPKAEDAARQNAAYNGFSAPEFMAYTGNVTADRALMSRLAAERYDIVLLNIVADVIIRLAPVLPELLADSGALICSGILDTRLGDVTAALENAGLLITEICAEEEWRCICAKRSTL